MRLVQPVLDMGGFQHGHTYAGNPLACAAGLAVLGEVDRLGLIENAAAMGEVLMDGLRGLAEALSLHRRRARQGAADRRSSSSPIPMTMAHAAAEMKIGQRVLDLAYERGLIVYSRRVSAAACTATISWSARR